jgi:hypothetical protein
MIIYLTTNLINFKYYVGFDSYNISTYLGSGVLLQAAIEKYGVENFKKEILEEFDENDQSMGNWQDRERYYIFFYCSLINKELGYNLTEGGDGTCGYKPTIKQRKNNSRIQKISQNLPSVKKKKSESLYKYYREHPDEKMHCACHGEDNGMFGKVSPKRGKKDRPQTIRRKRISARKRVKNPQYIKNLSDGCIKRYEDPEERIKMSIAVTAALKRKREAKAGLVGKAA